MGAPFFVVNFVAIFVELGVDEVRDKACDEGELEALSNKLGYALPIMDGEIY